jgi:hypothetical protein
MGCRVFISLDDTGSPDLSMYPKNEKAEKMRVKA